MPSLDGIRVWLESSDNAAGLAKELECYTVKHISILKTVTAYVESTVNHYFSVCFTLPNDLEDGVNVDIEIDGVLCAELYRDAKDWTHRCFGPLIGAASERPFQFKEATLVEDDDERVLKDEYKLKNAGSIKLTFYKAKMLACKPVKDEEILKPNHDDKIYSEKDKKAMSHSIGFGEAREIPSMKFCHSESSDPANVPFATFIFYYRSRGLLEALGHIIPAEATSGENTLSEEPTPPVAESEKKAQANEADEEDDELPEPDWLTARFPKGGTASGAPEKAAPTSNLPKATSTSTSAPAGPAASASQAPPDKDSCSSTSASASSLPSASPSTSSRAAKTSLTPPTSPIANLQDVGETISVPANISETGTRRSEAKTRDIDDGGGDEATPAEASSSTVAGTGPSRKRKGKEKERIKGEVQEEEEDELPDEASDMRGKKIKLERLEDQYGTPTASPGPSASTSRRSETVESMHERIEKLEAENRRLQEQVARNRQSSMPDEAMDTKPAIPPMKTATWIIDLTSDDDDD